MRINIIAGQTSCPYAYAYDGSLGEDPIPLIELKNDDGTFTYDDTILVERDADGSHYLITGEPDDNGKFLYSYRFILTGSQSTNPITSFFFPLTLPFILQ